MLTQFNGVEWTSGNRSIVQGQTANGLLPFPEQGLANTVPTDPQNYTVTATSQFDSRWLPTHAPGVERERSGRLALGRRDHGLHRRQRLDQHRRPELDDELGSSRSCPTTR